MLTFAIIYIIACIVAGVWFCWRAPDGYQDETGFHLIPPTLSDNEGTPLEQVFRIRHDAGADLTEPFHARPHNEGSQHNHG